jgi:CelD/BcsL family acetyltransferase involved in cellulose biosynthesis
LRWLSSGAACADYLNLFTRPGYEAAFADVAVRWLSRNIGPQKLLGRLDEIELEGIALDQPEVAYFNNKMTKAGFQNHQTEIEGCWAVDLPKSWADLEQTFSKSMRRKTKKATKRLNEKDTAVRSSHKADFDELWSTFVLLHQKRRQMLGQSGCFADTAFEAFLRDAVRELATSGHAEIVEIQHAGQPLASMILLNDNKTVYMFQSGTCDQRSALEPGYQLAACAIQRSINMGFACFDFLRGDEPYKARWNTNRVTLSRVKFIPRNFTAQLKHSLWLTGRSLKEHVYAGA